jgi:GT2 family glycosyltransferase
MVKEAAPESTPDRAIPAAGLGRASAVVSTWNKKDDLRENLRSLQAQTRPFAEIIVVDNASKGETFNIGFAAARSELIAILDDDIVMQPAWLEKATDRLAREPATTAILSTQVVEPGTPQSYLDAPAFNRERYMSTFRGCASLARASALRQAGGYDERLFIYGNERDLTCRLLNLGYRVLQYPGTGVFHKTPFGIKMGKRSLYYHARNAWLTMLKYAPLKDLARMPFLVFFRVILRGEAKEAEGGVTDATGTIGIGRSLRETPGAWWVVARAAWSVLLNVPYCVKHRHPVRAPDFELPIQ